MQVKHKFHSPKDDGPDSTLVRPGNWNEEHDFELATASVVGALEPGPAVELPLMTSSGADDGTIWTKQAVIDAIADAIAAIPTPPTGIETGDLLSTMRSAKSGWILANGQSIGNVGSGATFADATAEALFTLFWEMLFPVWVILPSRGATAAADWAALKTLALPDARGRTLVMPDLGAGVNDLINLLNDMAGEQNHVLLESEMPSHQHDIEITNAGGGSVGGGSVMMQTPGSVGQGTKQFGGSQPHNNVQPSLGANIFIKL